MNVLMVVQAQWGARIADHVQRTRPASWTLATWTAPAQLPRIIDAPGEYLPDALPATDLLVVLSESVGLTDLAPDLAVLSQAEAVLLPVDDRAHVPLGLRGQVAQRLSARGIGGAFPTPFCSLVPRAGHHPHIRAFAQHYGRPDLTCTTVGGCVAACQVTRSAPCGSTHYVAEQLRGVAVARAPGRAGLLQQYYPCWASAVPGATPPSPPVDGGGLGGAGAFLPPASGGAGGGRDARQARRGGGDHALLHIAAHLSEGAVKRALRDVQPKLKENP